MTWKNNLQSKNQQPITLSQEETRRWSLWLEKRRFEIPSVGGLDSSLPVDSGGAAVMINLIHTVLRVKRA